MESQIMTRPIITRAIQVFVSCFLLTQFLNVAQAQDARKQEIQRQMGSLVSLLQPSAKQKFLQAVRVVEDKIISSSGKVDTYASSVSAVKSQFGDLSSQDIDVLVSLVMFEVWKSEEEALREIMDEMHKMNQAKEKQRDYMESLKKQKALYKDKLRESRDKAIAPQSTQIRPAMARISREMATTRRLNIKYTKTPTLPPLKDVRQMSASQLEEEIQSAEANLNSMGDMSQLQQLQLQDAMQKQQQVIQTISNIMKNQHDTLKSIIQNLK
jgi:hypothetical protein